MASILVICTGNVCRSPIAQGFLAAALRARFGDRAPEVDSSGTSGWEGSAAMPESVRAAAERGIDISDHVARKLTQDQVEGADLVVAMAAEHRDAVVRAVPDAADKSFTLKELVRLLEAMPPPLGDLDPEKLSSRVAEAAALRRAGFEGNPNDQDVMDPLGMEMDSYRAVAWELDGWAHRLADGLFGRAPVQAAARGDEE